MKEREIKRDEEKKRKGGREKKEIKRLKGRVSIPFRDHISKGDVEPDNKSQIFLFLFLYYYDNYRQIHNFNCYRINIYLIASAVYPSAVLMLHLHKY